MSPLKPPRSPAQNPYSVFFQNQTLEVLLLLQNLIFWGEKFFLIFSLISSYFFSYSRLNSCKQ